MKDVVLYTDGACSGNPGPGGWGCILKYGDHKKELAGYVAETTNNRMEVFAVIMGLRALKTACNVMVYSDSAYLVNAFQLRWIHKWQRNGWKNSSNKPVENQDLWRCLMIEMDSHNVSFVKVKGHADNPWNNRCDFLATQAIKLQQDYSSCGAETLKTAQNSGFTQS